jgi:hypothetical protein
MTPAYRPLDGSPAAPAPASSSGWFARLFGCGLDPTYLAPPSPPRLHPGNNNGGTPGTSSEGSSTPSSGTTVARKTLLVVPDSFFAMLKSEAIPIRIVRTVDG